MSQNNQTEGKAVAAVTYLVAVAAAVAGFFLPLTDKTFAGGGMNFATAPFMLLGGALAKCGIPVNAAFGGTYSYAAGAFDLGAVLLLWYALTAAISVILVVAVFAAKAEKCQSVAAVGELLLVSALLPLTVLEFLRGGEAWNLNVLFALGGTAVALFIQCAAYKKGSGAVKIILFLLSAAVALLISCSVAAFIPALEVPFQNFANSLKGAKPFETGTGLYSVNGANLYAKDLFGYVMRGDFGFGGEGAAAAGWIGFILVCLIYANLFLDALGTGKKTRGFMLAANVIRYGAELVLMITFAITLVFAPANYGVMLYIAAFIAAVQFIIQICRAVRYAKAAKALQPETPAVAAAGEESPALPEETAAASGEPVVETRQVVYNVNTIYNGPTDEFIKKLTVDQKVEFARLFLEKRTGSSHGIPDYVIGGDNSRFFSMLFIYFTRIRDLVSDGLMNKFYEEVKLM